MFNFIKKKYRKFDIGGDINADQQYKQINGQWFKFENGQYLPVEQVSDNDIDFSDGFKTFNTMLDTTQAIAGFINEGKNQRAEKNKYLQAVRNSMNVGYNPNANGVNNVPVYFATGGMPEKTASKYNINSELEKGEVFETNDGNIQKVAESEPTHENGGSPQANVSRVLEDTADKRVNIASNLLKINPSEALNLVGVETKKPLTHSKLYELAAKKYDSEAIKLGNKISDNIDYLNNNGGIYAQNALDENIKTLESIPVKAELFDDIYNHQEELKQKYAIAAEDALQKYGGRPKMAGGGKIAKGGTQAVYDYQVYLNTLGAKLKPDGAWGKDTQAAFEKYANNLDPVTVTTNKKKEEVTTGDSERKINMDDYISKTPYYSEFSQPVANTTSNKTTSGTVYDKYLNEKLGNESVKDLFSRVSKNLNIDPSFLYANAMGEGMNKYIDGVKGRGTSVYDNISLYDGLGFYGVDDNYKRYLKEGVIPKNLKSYLDDAGHLQIYSPEEGLIIQSSILNDNRNKVKQYIKKNNIKLTPEQEDYFTSAFYNAGEGRGGRMIQDYNNRGYLKNNDFIFTSDYIPEDNPYKDVSNHVVTRIRNKQKLNNQFAVGGDPGDGYWTPHTRFKPQKNPYDPKNLPFGYGNNDYITQLMQRLNTVTGYNYPTTPEGLVQMRKDQSGTNADFVTNAGDLDYWNRNATDDKAYSDVRGKYDAIGVLKNPLNFETNAELQAYMRNNKASYLNNNNNKIYWTDPESGRYIGANVQIGSDVLNPDGSLKTNTPQMPTVNTTIPTVNPSVPPLTVNGTIGSNNKPSTFYEPLRLSDVGTDILGLLEQREPVPLEQMYRNQLRVRELNPLPTLLQNQGDYNAALDQLPDNGVGYANIANLQANKYKVNNEVLGQYENINKQREDSIDQFNDQSQFALRTGNMELRDQFNNRVLQSKEALRQQRMESLKGIFDKISQNRRVNRDGNLIMEMYPYFDQYGKFNNDKYTLSYNGLGGYNITDKTSGKVVKVISKQSWDTANKNKGTSRTTITQPE